MAARAAEAPAGRVSEVFSTARERDGAYDFLESDAVKSSALLDAAANACLERCAAHAHVFVPVDGTSLTLVDRRRSKGFGSVGSSDQGITGLNVMTAIAVDPTGVPLGLCDMQWWARARRRKERKTDTRPVSAKETQRWLDAIAHTVERAEDRAPHTRLWFQLDREGDSWPVLHDLSRSGALFTVRSCANRRVVPIDGKNRLREVVAAAPVRASYAIDVPATKKRSAHRASLEVRSAVVTLDMRDLRIGAHHMVRVTAVWVTEVGSVRPGEEPVDWMLLTNASLTSLDTLWHVVFGYCQRWRIEDFHRTWKRGGCNVEESQLRAIDHVTKWATILAAVAMRIERLKHLSRSTPEQPASIELSAIEIQALILLKKKQKKRTEIVLDTEPTIGQAVLWMAELGGFTGKSSGGPPGSQTIGRGLEKVQTVAGALEALEQMKPRRHTK